MSKFSLAGVAEQESKFTPFTKVLPGIHNVDILDVYFQPKGESVRGVKFKDTLSVYNQDELIISFKITDTITKEHGDCKGFEGSVSVYEPSGVDSTGKACLSFQLSRIVHIFSNMVEFKDKETAVTHLQKVSGDFKAISEGIAKVMMARKRKTRLKLVKNSKGTRAVFPNYYQGFVECHDAPTSKLTFDASKDKFPEGPVNVEIPQADTYEFPETDQSKVESPKTEDELPPF